MALNPNELYNGPVTQARDKRIAPEILKPKEFASGSGTLAVGCVVAFNSSTKKWVPWANGGANDTGTPRGIVFPFAITLDSDEEVIGQVMLGGRAHASDLIDNATGDLSANLTAALRSVTISPTLRELGITIEGLSQIF